MSFVAVPFQESHLNAMDIGIVEMEEISQATGNGVRDQQGNAVTVLDHDKPVAVFGAVWVDHGHILLSSVITDHARGKPLSLCRIIRECMDPVINAFDLSIIDVTVHRDYSKGIRFAKSFGFDIIELQDEYLLMRYKRCQQQECSQSH